MKHLIYVLLSTLCLYSEKLIEIDLTTQTLKAINNNKVELESNITSGKAGHTTPNGVFKVLEKKRKHISNLYPIKDKVAGIRGGASMPYMLRVTNTGIAIHAGEMVKYPDSHGCIRLPYGKAMQLFKWTEVGVPIKIIGETAYDDPINKMRLSLLHTSKKKPKMKNQNMSTYVPTPSVKWVDQYLNYYEQM